MSYFFKFMGWAILYSFFYFFSLDIIGIPPGHESPGFQKIFNYGILFVLSIPIWWFTWKKFETAFGPKEVQIGGNITEHRISIRNPELVYYLMLLKPFLLALGANGIIALSYHEGSSRIFYIVNFIVLYIYALPFLIIKTKKLINALGSSIIMDKDKIGLVKNSGVLVEIPFKSIEKLVIDESSSALLIDGGSSKLYIGGPEAKASGFYTNGANDIIEKLKEKNGPKVEIVDSIKDALKDISFKPLV